MVWAGLEFSTGKQIAQLAQRTFFSALELGVTAIALPPPPPTAIVFCEDPFSGLLSLSTKDPTLGLGPLADQDVNPCHATTPSGALPGFSPTQGPHPQGGPLPRPGEPVLFGSHGVGRLFLQGRVLSRNHRANKRTPGLAGAMHHCGSKG